MILLILSHCSSFIGVPVDFVVVLVLQFTWIFDSQYWFDYILAAFDNYNNPIIGFILYYFLVQACGVCRGKQN